MSVGARLQIRMSIIRPWFTIISETNKVIKNMNVEPRPCTHKHFKNVATTVKSMDIELLNVDPNPCGHQTRKQR